MRGAAFQRQAGTEQEDGWERWAFHSTDGWLGPAKHNSAGLPRQRSPCAPGVPCSSTWVMVQRRPASSAAVMTRMKPTWVAVGGGRAGYGAGGRWLRSRGEDCASAANAGWWQRRQHHGRLCCGAKAAGQGSGPASPQPTRWNCVSPYTSSSSPAEMTDTTAARLLRAGGGGGRARRFWSTHTAGNGTKAPARQAPRAPPRPPGAPRGLLDAPRNGKHEQEEGRGGLAHHIKGEGDVDQGVVAEPNVQPRGHAVGHHCGRQAAGGRLA